MAYERRRCVYKIVKEMKESIKNGKYTKIKSLLKCMPNIYWNWRTMQATLLIFSKLFLVSLFSWTAHFFKWLPFSPVHSLCGHWLMSTGQHLPSPYLISLPSKCTCWGTALQSPLLHLFDDRACHPFPLILSSSFPAQVRKVPQFSSHSTNREVQGFG